MNDERGEIEMMKVVVDDEIIRDEIDEVVEITDDDIMDDEIIRDEIDEVVEIVDDEVLGDEGRG